MVSRVTARAGPMQRVAEATFEILDQGPASGLGDLEAINGLFQEGELGELQLFLRPELSDADRREVQEAVAELEAELEEEGALPWPGRSRIAELDWPNRTVRFFFQQGFPALLAILAIVLRVAAFALTIPLLVELLQSIGVSVPSSIEDVGGAVALIVAIAGSILVLRRLGLPLTLLIPGGLLVFALLQPDIAFRVLKWAREAVERAFGFDPLLVGGGAVAALVGVGLAAQGRGAAVPLGLGVAAAGAGLAIFGFTGGIARAAPPEGPPPPTGAVLEVVGDPTFNVTQI